MSVGFAFLRSTSLKRTILYCGNEPNKHKQKLQALRALRIERCQQQGEGNETTFRACCRVVNVVRCASSSASSALLFACASERCASNFSDAADAKVTGASLAPISSARMVAASCCSFRVSKSDSMKLASSAAASPPPPGGSTSGSKAYASRQLMTTLRKRWTCLPCSCGTRPCLSEDASGDSSGAFEDSATGTCRWSDWLRCSFINACRLNRCSVPVPWTIGPLDHWSRFDIRNPKQWTPPLDWHGLRQLQDRTPSFAVFSAAFRLVVTLLRHFAARQCL